MSWSLLSGVGKYKFVFTSARMTARSSSPNRTNTLTKGSIRTQVNLVYGNCNRMSLLAGNGHWCIGIYGLLASQSCYHSMLAPCWFTLWTSSRFLYPYILLISLEIFLFSCDIMHTDQIKGFVFWFNICDRIYENRPFRQDYWTEILAF